MQNDQQDRHGTYVVTYDVASRLQAFRPKTLTIPRPDDQLFERFHMSLYQKVQQALPGITIDTIGSGTATVSMPDDQKLHNHLGTPHAGALFTLAETASGAAMAGGFAELIPSLRPVAKESRIQYQKVAKGATRAVGRVPGDLAALKAELKAQGKSADEAAATLRMELPAKYPEWIGPNNVTIAAATAYKELP